MSVLHTLQLRLDWSDMDMFGHINNVSYFRFLQSARVNCWEAIGLSAMYAAVNQGPVLVSCQCKFIKPLHYPGTIEVKSMVSVVGTTSFGLKHSIYNSEGQLCAEGDDVMVMFDFTSNQKIPVPDFLRA
ncbi:MAG: acyl-CoA thioesterase [Chitinophagia bacterium]|nr:acyl-CoA thioesterase [Chitinophagia bacterium]